MSYARNQRRLHAREATKVTCRGCGRAVFFYPKGTDKVSHETPICAFFRESFARVCAEHDLETYQGATYLAQYIDPSKPEGQA